MTPEEREKELNGLPPEPKRDYAFLTLRNIMLAAQSDAIGHRQKLGADSKTLCLYEILFLQQGLGINIYLKKPVPGEIRTPKVRIREIDF